MKKVKFVLMGIIIVFFSSISYYYQYCDKSLPENIQPFESVFSIDTPEQGFLNTEAKVGSGTDLTGALKPSIVRSRPSNQDFEIGKKLAADLSLWPLSQNPDFWLLRAHVRREDWPKAMQALKEALEKPQPWHFRFAFSWILTRIEFILWLKQPPDNLARQIKNSLTTLAGDFPAIFADKQFKLGVGYLASDSKEALEFPSSGQLLASTSAALLTLVYKPDNFARWFLQDQTKSQRYCQKLRRSMNILITQPEISERYAAVDYVYQSRQLYTGNMQVAGVNINKTIKTDLEKNWNRPNLPICCGRLLSLSRNQWVCSLHESLDVSLATDADDFMLEAWSGFLLCNPHLLADSSENQILGGTTDEQN